MLKFSFPAVGNAKLLREILATQILPKNKNEKGVRELIFLWTLTTQLHGLKICQPSFQL